MPIVDPGFRYVWLIWASVFLLPWTALLVVRPALRRPMLWSSALTAPLGLSELLFVPAVWSLDDLITWRPAGLPLEELMFGFGFGMYWSSVYEHITWRQRDASRESSLPTGSMQHD